MRTAVLIFLFCGLVTPTGRAQENPAVARANARRLGVGIREELVRLVVHGVLHALGHDHPEGEARFRSPMWLRQEALVKRAMRRAARRAA